MKKFEDVILEENPIRRQMSESAESEVNHMMLDNKSEQK